MMNDEKVRYIRDIEPPTNLRRLQHFLGVCNWLKKFIKDYAAIVHPLTLLTRKNQKFVWGEDQQKAFETLKEKITSYPCLRFPDPDRQFRLTVDSSDFACGAVLSQQDDQGRDYVIAYASRQYSDREITEHSTYSQRNLRDCLRYVPV